MKPVEFREMTGVYPISRIRKTPLPVFVVGDDYNQVITCWELSEDELKTLYETNLLWIRQLQMGSANLQPILPHLRS